MTNRGKTKKKTKSLKRNTVTNDEIILKIQMLRYTYIFYDSKTKKLMPVNYNNDSKIPFNELIFMIKHSENLETQGETLHYVFPYLLDTYLNDMAFLTDNKISDKIIGQFNTLYINVIIECIREYLNNPKYKTDITVQFWNTIQRICNNSNIKDRIIYLLNIKQDPLLKKEVFRTLCDEKIPTQVQLEIQPITMGKIITNNHLSYAHASELPRPVVVEEEAPDYYDPRTRQPIYNNPITWTENILDRLSKLKSRSRSRGGKRKTKKSTKKNRHSS